MSRRNGRFAFCKQDGDVQDAVAALLAVGGQAPAPVAAPAPIPAPALSPSVRAVEILTACVEELRQSKGEPRRRKGPQPPSASEFEVGFADAPTDHVAPLPTQDGGAPGAERQCVPSLEPSCSCLCGAGTRRCGTTTGVCVQQGTLNATNFGVLPTTCSITAGPRWRVHATVALSLHVHRACGLRTGGARGPR